MAPSPAQTTGKGKPGRKGMPDSTEMGAVRRPVLFRVPRRRAALAAAGAGALPASVGGKKTRDMGGRRRKKKMAVARLGGGERRRLRLFGAIGRRLRMRWLAAVYRRALRRLRAFYARALQDLLEGAAAMSTLRAEAGGDCSFGNAFVPVVVVGGRHY